jgi:cell division protein FtsB
VEKKRGFAAMLVMALALSVVLTGCGPKALAGQVYKLEQKMAKVLERYFEEEDEKKGEKLEAQGEKLDAQYEKLKEKYDKLSEKDQEIYDEEYSRLSD